MLYHGIPDNLEIAAPVWRCRSIVKSINKAVPDK
jgi:hypothetical protein